MSPEDRIRDFVLTFDFISAAYQLPQEILRKSVKALILFAKDRAYPSLHLESLSGAATGLHSIRVDDKYRVLLALNPIPTLIFVGAHDDVYRFAERNSRIEVHVAECRSEIAQLLRGTEHMPKASIRTDLLWHPAPQLIEVQGLDSLILDSRKYSPLADFLARMKIESVRLNFAGVEKIIGERLPETARQDPNWWANDITHVQSLAWMVAGWRKDRVELALERVSFMRVH